MSSSFGKRVNYVHKRLWLMVASFACWYVMIQMYGRHENSEYKPVDEVAKIVIENQN